MKKGTGLALTIASLVLLSSSLPFGCLCGSFFAFRFVQKRMIGQMNDDLKNHGDLLPPHRLKQR